MKYFSMYSGVGGFEYGIKEAISILRDRSTRPKHGRGSESVLSQQESLPSTEIPSVTCIGYSEIDKYAIAVYKYNYGTDIKNYGNADEINAEELPDFDLLVGGFPCQAFSIAGKRRGFYDTRGTQFFNVARIAKQKQPRLLVLENVKGLLSHDKGKTFHTIIATLDELGYDVEWQVLNSKNHGAPQNRERVFIIGCLRGRGGRQVFSLGHSNQENNASHRQGDTTRTITTAHAHGTATNMSYIKKEKIRRLTPTECERLQGFPDDWTKYGIIDGEVKQMSDTQRYKMMGNAVTTNVVRDIMSEVLK